MTDRPIRFPTSDDERSMTLFARETNARFLEQTERINAAAGEALASPVLRIPKAGDKRSLDLVVRQINQALIDLRDRIETLTGCELPFPIRFVELPKTTGFDEFRISLRELNLDLANIAGAELYGVFPLTGIFAPTGITSLNTESEIAWLAEYFSNNGIQLRGFDRSQRYARSSANDLSVLIPGVRGSNVIRPAGVHRDEDFFWVAAGDIDDQVFGFNKTTGAREPGRDISTLTAAGILRPEGIWGNNSTVWIGSLDDLRIRAFNRSNGTRDHNKDITHGLVVGHADHDFWSDGTTMWVLLSHELLAAYQLSDGARDSSKDIRNWYAQTEFEVPVAITGDSTHLLILSQSGADGRYRIRAIKLSDRTRDTSRDIDLTSIFTDSVNRSLYSRMLWSDGSLLWLAQPSSSTTPTTNSADLIALDRTDPANVTLDTSRTATVRLPETYFFEGLWGDGSSFLVLGDHTATQIYCLDPDTGTRVANRDIEVELDPLFSRFPHDGGGLWGSDTTLYLAYRGRNRGNEIIAYNKLTGALDESESFTPEINRNLGERVRGIWADDHSFFIYSVRHSESGVSRPAFIKAYDRVTKRRTPDRDIAIPPPVEDDLFAGQGGFIQGYQNHIDIVVSSTPDLIARLRVPPVPPAVWFNPISKTWVSDPPEWTLRSSSSSSAKWWDFSEDDQLVTLYRDLGNNWNVIDRYTGTTPDAANKNPYTESEWPTGDNIHLVWENSAGEEVSGSFPAWGSIVEFDNAVWWNQPYSGATNDTLLGIKRDV